MSNFTKRQWQAVTWFFTSPTTGAGLEYDSADRIADFLAARSGLVPEWRKAVMDNIGGLIDWHDYSSARDTFEMMVLTIQMLNERKITK